MNTTFEEELNNSGKLLYTNVGISMLPLLREGKDVMIIERADEYRRLDAVLFRRPGVSGRGAYVLHRILKKRGDGQYWIVGDNCTDGETVEETNILGVLTGIKRGDRLIRVTDLNYRMYVYLWCAPYHVRFFILKIGRFMRRVKGWLKRHVF
ncbi:MAG: S24/S26 family peptidase [Clostridia bacterium]|nr:S24/S26 family peptidase [Clostridia bacterium]